MTYRMSDKAHKIYKAADGKRVPSVSTIASVMDKPFLVGWANRLGLAGVESTKYVDSLATAGTLTHYFVECDVRGEGRDAAYMKEFSPLDVDRAETSFVKYNEWRSQHVITLVASELELVSEKHRFGGRLDLILNIDGVDTLVDVKTAKGLYGDADDKWAQVAGYKILANEHGYQLERAAILRLGREPAEGFEFAEMPKPELQERRFLICRELYDVQAALKKVAI